MDRTPPRAHLVTAARLLALCSAYVALGKLGLALSPISSFASLVWAPSGVSLAALVLAGYRLWPAVALGAFVTNLWTGAPPLVACAIAAGNTLEAVLGTWALRRIPGFRSSLDRFADVACLVVLAGVSSTTISATIGTAALQLGGLVGTLGFARTWLAWWLGDLMGILLVAPVLLTSGKGRSLPGRPARLGEIVALAGFLVASATLVFFQRAETAAESPFLMPYVLFLPQIWAALRFGTRGAAISMLVVAPAAIAGTFLGYGAFARADPADGFLALHVFLGAASMASLALGSVVAEREQARKLAQEGEAARAGLAALVESSSDAIIGQALDGTITSWNEAAEHLYGYARDEAIGRPVSMLFPPDRVGEAAELLARVARGERGGQHETVRCRKDGAEIDVAVTVSPILDLGGSVVGASTIARDIGERKRIEAELRHSEERHRLAVLAAGLGTWSWEPRRDKLVWSPLCKRMHALAEGDEPSYARFLAALHPDDRAETERAVARSIAERGDYRIEHRVLWPDGSVHWLSVLGRPLYEDSGAIDRLLGVTMDVTPQKQAEQRERAAARAKDEFLAVLSHELRNPLAPIKSSLYVLDRVEPASPQAQRARAVIEHQVAHLTRLVDDLLDVNRISRGKIELKRARVDLVAVVERTLGDLRSVFTARRIALEGEVPARPLWLDGDPDRLAQVFGNLLNNAAKFTPAGGQVLVTLGDDDGWAVLRVRDTGVGICADMLDHVFEPFTQGAQSLDRSAGGLGLGLALVKALVSLHGGEVRARSAGAGQGAELEVRLPLDDAQPEEPPRSTIPETRARARRVLVIEDNLDAADSLKEALSLSGHAVEVAYDGPDGLEAVRRFSPDVVVCDVGLPGMDGYAVAQALRCDTASEGVVLVALTGYALAEDRRQALAAGFDLHLAKPLDLDALERILADMPPRRAARGAPT